MSTFPGQLLADRYRLDAHIATGGMGEVWKATDTTLQRVVAIKILSPGLAGDAVFRQRFAAEARTVAALRAPGVVAVHDAVETITQDGRPLAFIVMEYISGTSLATLLHEQGRLAPDHAMSLVAQVADALDAAHRAGIVHRDVKPGNIIVGSADRVTIVDFGVARVQGQAALTAPGSVLATIRYAAPEQLAGEELGPAADIYSLGVVAYECLTGDAPFSGESTAAIITGHLRKPPPALPPQTPPQIAAVVLKALAKDPAHRHLSAAAFAAACRGEATPPIAATAPPPTRVLPVGPATRVMPQAEHPTALAAPAGRPRHRRHMVIGAATAAAAIIGVLLLIWGLNAGPDEPGTNPSTGAEPDQAPEVPAESRLASASAGDCLHASEDDKEAHLADCGSAATISFSPTADAYRFSLHDGEEQRCLALSGNREKIELKDCDEAETWTVTWLGTADGRDRWRVASSTHPGQCLSASGETSEDDGKGKGKGNDDKDEKDDDEPAHQAVTLATCGSGDDQAWLTGR